MEMKEDEFLKLHKDKDLAEVKVGKGLYISLNVDRRTAHEIRRATAREIIEHLKKYQNYISPDLLDQIFWEIKKKYNMYVEE